MWAVCEAWTL